MANKQNCILYKDQPLLEGPNTFVLDWGTRPSFGKFRMTQEAYDALAEEGEVDPNDSDIVGELKFMLEDDEEIDEESIVALQNIHLVRATFDPKSGVYDVILADKRIKWMNTFGTKDYNTYAASRRLLTNDYALENTNSGVNWTYEEVLEDLLATDVPELPRAVTREPRNIRGKGRSYSDILQQIMFELNCYLVLDPYEDVYKIFALGVINPDDSDVIADMEGHIYEERIINEGGLWKPARIYAAVANLAAGSFDYLEALVSEGVTNGRMYITSYTNSVDGGTYADEFAEELAADIKDAAEWRDVTYNGIHKLTPSSEIHQITFISNDSGAFTKIKRLFPQSVPPQLPSHAFAANGYTFPSSTGISLYLYALATGNGKYIMRRMSGGDGEISSSDATSASDVGAPGAGGEVLGINMWELDANGDADGHALSVDTDRLPRHFEGYPTGQVDEEDREVFRFYGFQWGCPSQA